jgi:hypothetical protein
MSCLHLQNNDTELRNVNKYLIYYNHNTNEICFFDIDTGNISKNYEIGFEILFGGAINSLGFSHTWFHRENDKNLYLLERSRRISRIFRINLENWDLTEILQTNTSYYKLSIDEDNIYLLNYVESTTGSSNKDQNHIISHNTTTGIESIINFNRLLPESEQVYATKFYVHEAGIVFIGYVNINEIFFKNIYLYNSVNNTLKVIDKYVNRFSIFDTMILYDKNDLEISIDDDLNKTATLFGTQLYIYNLENNTYIILPNYAFYYFDFLIVDQSTIIYVDINQNKTIDFKTNKIFINYYLASINENKNELMFSSFDEITLLGVLKK